MKILMLCDFYPPFIGGIERHVQTLSRELVRRGHRVAVATLHTTDLPFFELDEGVRVYRLKGWNRLLKSLYQTPGRHWLPPAPDPGIVAGLRRVVREEQPDIVHARGWILYSFLPLKTWSRARLVVTLHDYSLPCPRKNYMYEGRSVCAGPDYRKCVRCASGQYGSTAKSLVITTGLYASSHLHRYVERFLAVSEAVKEASLHAAVCPPRHIEVVPTFIPDTVLDEAARAGRPSFLPPEDNYLLYVGGLREHKGLHVLLEAYARLREPVPLLLLGTSWDDTPSDFPKGVTAVFDVPHDLVMGAWAHCAVGVVPSIWPEPFGQVAVECMAVGKPVIATGVGGLKDVVLNGETGLLVPPADAGSLRVALERLLADPQLRARMGEAGARRARQFMVGTVADRIEEIYREEMERALLPAGR